MLERIAVKRYAESFMELARQDIGVDKAVEEFKNLKGAIIRDNPDFLGFLENPGISFTEKCAFIDKVLNVDFSDITRHFLKLLVQKGRIDRLADIAEYIRFNYSHGRRTEALLKISSLFDLKLIKDIEDRLERKFGKKFKFYIDLDADILGGIQVIIGNTVLDGSLRKRLNELRARLMNIKV
ncbi:MAG: ATP synthase F1 subunit delta [Candidatus Omnitrophica bacterium]|nr:ATP synthase F1 subunit delta [Candidatus Omnitrophota bacterium]